MRAYEFLREASLIDFGENNRELSNIIDNADKSLTGDAAIVINDFIGMPYNHNQSVGIMFYDKIEGVFSDHPTINQSAVMDELSRAFLPVKKALLSVFGHTIRLYRYQPHYDDTSKARNVLSWTSDKNVAISLSGFNRKIEPPLSDSDIKQIVDQYKKTGEASYKRVTIVKNQEEPGYFDIYNNGEHVILDNNLLDYLQGIQEDEVEIWDENQKYLDNIIEADVDINDIIWISNRAGQKEFILKNKPHMKHFIDHTGKPSGKNN